LLQLEWKDIDWDYDNRCLNIPENYVHWRKKAPPIVPLSQLAYWTLNAYKNTIPEHLRKPNAKVFQIKERNHALEWERICDAANIDDLHWHDLRRTAITTWQDPRLPRDLQLTSQEIAYIGWNSPPRDGHKMAGTYTANEAIHIANAIRDRLDGIDAAYYRDPERSGPPLDEIAQRRAFELPEEVRRRQPFDEDAGKALWQWEDDTYGLGTTMWTDEHGVKHWVNYGPVIDGKRQITRGTGEYPDT
jgi:hypothetical protein